MSKQRFPNAVDHEMGQWLCRAARSDLRMALQVAREGNLEKACRIVARAVAELHESHRFTARFVREGAGW
jgi:cellobiose-specific phosphotransferase system component IIA